MSSHNVDQYNTFRLAFVSAAPDEKAFTLDALRSFIHQAVLENVAANIHKEFVSYYNPVDKQQLLLLGNRKTYSTDKAKIQRLEINKKKRKRLKQKQMMGLPCLPLRLMLLQNFLKEIFLTKFLPLRIQQIANLLKVWMTESADQGKM